MNEFRSAQEGVPCFDHHAAGEVVILVSRLTSHASMNLSSDRVVISNAFHDAPSRTFKDIGSPTQILQRSRQSRPRANSIRRAASSRCFDVVGAVGVEETTSVSTVGEGAFMAAAQNHGRAVGLDDTASVSLWDPWATRKSDLCLAPGFLVWCES